MLLALIFFAVLVQYWPVIAGGLIIGLALVVTFCLWLHADGWDYGPD